MSYFAHPVTVTVRRSGVDPRTQDPLPASTHQIPDCAWAPRRGDETTAGRNTVIAGLTLYAPYDADILATDEVLIPGDPVWWQVDGEPGPWRNPFTDWQPGLEVALSRQRG